MLLQRAHRGGVSGLNGFRVGRDDLFVSVMQHFDQAVFQLEALVKQAAELFEFLDNALAFIAKVVERE